MLPKLIHPDPAQWNILLRRPSAKHPHLETQVRAILSSVQTEGDTAVRRHAGRFDGHAPDPFLIDASEIQNVNLADDRLETAIQTAIANIRKFHTAQMPREVVVETMPGVICRSRALPIEKVGLYIPGGTAPLFSTLLMLAVPAQIAGCRDIVVCTPPGRDGKVSPVLLYAARELGITQIYRVGGAQAIAAMAYGTESIPKVDKLFGPGNAYVTCAKILLQTEGVAIDLPAGPSELAVLADASADPAFVAADLLSQAEHGADSQVLLVTDSPQFIEAVGLALTRQLETLPRIDYIRQSLAHSFAVLVHDMNEGVALINSYAPEHLILACKDSELVADRIINAGSVFIGPYTPESVGDYASGTNHTLPTNGHARAYSGVTTASFMKTISFQHVTREGLKTLAPAVMAMAEAEGLRAHARAVQIRLQQETFEQ